MTTCYLNTGKNLNPNPEIVVRVGSSIPIVDITRNLLSIPAKILLLNPSFNSGNISDTTIEKVKEYLSEKGLNNVEVAVNEYNPKREWTRMMSNPKTSTFAKYTLGILGFLFETLFCSKLTGFPGDRYNPMSDTIHLHSDDPSIALLLCGYAKEYNSCSYPSLYAASNAIPYAGAGIFVYQHIQALEEASNYLSEKGDIEGEKRAWKALVPLSSACIAAAVAVCIRIPGEYFPGFALGALGIGHVLGNLCAYATGIDPAKVQRAKDCAFLREILSKMPTPAPTPTSEAAPAA